MKLAERRTEIWDTYAERVEQLLRAQILKFWEKAWGTNERILRDSIDEALLNDEKRIEYQMVLISDVRNALNHPYPFMKMVVEWDDKGEKIWKKMEYRRRKEIIAKALKEGTQDFFEDANIEIKMMNEEENFQNDIIGDASGAVITINFPPTTPNN